MSALCVDWFAGASAQLELFSPSQDRYQLKYTPAFRATMRPPVEDRPLGPNELRPIDDEVERALDALNTRRGPRAPGVADANSTVMDMLATAGGLLYDVSLPSYVQADLRTADRFLEIGVDEGLLGYPWELMHDGEEFLCFRHLVGRFINSTTGLAAPMMPGNLGPRAMEKVSVLVIVVPSPPPRADGTKYESLPAAEEEAKAITDTLAALPDVDLRVLAKNDATFTGVVNALKKKVHIVHYCGHARFDDASPRKSSLVLYDKDMTTGFLLPYFQMARPIFCFINACQSASATLSKSNFNVIGLARTFLESGAYLLGSRWKVADQGAAVFAKVFYDSLLIKHESLGRAVRDARVACRAVSAADLVWASYVLYGDPRLCFRKC